MAELQLRKDHNDDALYSGGNVTYRVHDGDCWIGWVGDGRKWLGHKYGARKWWACWREDGDAAARWSTGLRYDSRQAALDGLAAHRAGAVDLLPEFEPTRAAGTVPDGVHTHTTGGYEYARWGQVPVVEAGAPIDPVPTVYSNRTHVEVDELQLTHAEAWQLIVRLRNAIAWERARAGHAPLLAVGADCPGCGHPGRTLDPVAGVFGCTECAYTSNERNA
ncbi:hypothetical protein SAMN04489727_1692 [Amycolatopsis tolypomycina]|uniref:Uncharacterized protein n=1 Tax=Amycolatopsis tolypomycina TaxID=208445 RepID=A0A1H4JA58_9PSEU|nr:hypothetical protein [Amycolatopsis tolypomycina]SEB43204.1 hypothetical protein SAMN04489727_1692 [Amycolatopsis tolypomycina]